MAIENLEREQSQFVLLRRYRDLPEAAVAKSILDAERIDCVLSDENLVRLDWFWSNLLGGAKLWVRRQDAGQAEDLINQSPLNKFEVEGVGEFAQPQCPRCQSLDISFRELNKRVAFITAYLGLPIPLRRRGWKCHFCGYSWRHSDNTQPSS